MEIAISVTDQKDRGLWEGEWSYLQLAFAHARNSRVKNENTSEPRALFKNDGRILVIEDVSPRDSGVHECKASNKFGESRTSR